MSICTATIENQMRRQKKTFAKRKNGIRKHKRNQKDKKRPNISEMQVQAIADMIASPSRQEENQRDSQIPRFETRLPMRGVDEWMLYSVLEGMFGDGGTFSIVVK